MKAVDEGNMIQYKLGEAKEKRSVRTSEGPGSDVIAQGEDDVGS